MSSTEVICQFWFKCMIFKLIDCIAVLQLSIKTHELNVSGSKTSFSQQQPWGYRLKMITFKVNFHHRLLCQILNCTFLL